MRMEIGLGQHLLQKQILSPQMIQSMEILVLNSQQLEEKIDQELEENVALEVEEPRVEQVAPGPAETEAASPVETGEATEIDLLKDRYEHLANYQSEEYENAPGRRSTLPTGEEDDKFEVLQNTPDRPESLQDHLLEQLRMRSQISDRLRELCHEIIYNLDHRGYLLFPVEEILEGLNSAPSAVDEGTNGSNGSNGTEAEALLHVYLSPIELPVTAEELQEALDTVRSLDPAGVGASDLQECLLLQLDRDPEDYPLERKLIENHLSDIAKNRLPQIAKAEGVGIEDVKESIEIIRSLNPKPGKEFASEVNSYVRPDVLVFEEEGVFKAQVDNDTVPRLRISPYYRELLEQSKKDPEIRKYIKKKIDNAEWLLHAIQQRKSTLQRVADEVVEHQQEFFKRGPQYLRPLKMQQIADRIGVNVSTVSRAISGKYFQSPGYIKELKFLFTGGTVRDDGTLESRASVIRRIKDLIAEENGRKPLSDSKIVDLLSKEGINISRRTVTKYREAEGIPSSRERKQY